jgi:hypothetical protein
MARGIRDGYERSEYFVIQTKDKVTKRIMDFPRWEMLQILGQGLDSSSGMVLLLDLSADLIIVL